MRSCCKQARRYTSWQCPHQPPLDDVERPPGFAEHTEREHFDLVICHMPWSMAVFGPSSAVQGRRLGFWAHGFHTGRGWLEHLAKRTTPDVAIANSRSPKKGWRIYFRRCPADVVYASHWR